MHMTSTSSRTGRKVAHRDWIWTRLGSKKEDVANQRALVKHMSEVEAANKTIDGRERPVQIIKIGAESIHFRLERAIKYDGAYKKIERMFDLLTVVGKNEWRIDAVEEVSMANVPSMILGDPQEEQGELPLTQTSAVLAVESGSSAAAATAAAFPYPLELMLPKMFVAMEDLSKKVGCFEREYKWLGKDAIGQGTYGTVRAARHIGTKTIVAIKNFRHKDADIRLTECLEELTFYIHLGRHPNIAEPVDVVANSRGIGIVLRHAGTSLEHFMQMSCGTRSGMHADAVNETCRQLVAGLEFMHARHVIHGDLKPKNILVNSSDFANVPWTTPLVCNINAVLADLGGSLWNHELLRYPHRRDRHLQTACWRAPEVAAGAVAFDGKVDVWSLAIILLEMAMGKGIQPVFHDVNTDRKLLEKIRKMLGHDGTDTEFFDGMSERYWHGQASDHVWEYLVQGSSGSADTAVPCRAWSCLGGDGVELLMQMLRPDPHGRLTATQVKGHMYCTRGIMQCVSHGVAGRGPFSLQAGHMENRILAWLRHDEYWDDAVKSLTGLPSRPKRQRTKTPFSGEWRKKEECYFFDASAPVKKSQFIGHLVTQRLPFVRLLAWGEAFKYSNAAWLEQLGTHLRRALANLAEGELGENGKQIARTDPRSWINQFVILQAMRPDERLDEVHYDGGASLLHIGLSLYGRRRLNLKVGEEILGAHSVVATPGHVYAGNLCAAEHQVVHESDHIRSDSFEAESDAVKIAVMLRTSLFGGWARTIKTAPSPKVVYEIANPVVAEHLRHHSLKLPSFEACLAAENAIAEEEMKRQSPSGCKQLEADTPLICQQQNL